MVATVLGPRAIHGVFGMGSAFNAYMHVFHSVGHSALTRSCSAGTLFQQPACRYVLFNRAWLVPDSRFVASHRHWPVFTVLLDGCCVGLQLCGSNNWGRSLGLKGGNHLVLVAILPTARAVLVGRF